MHAPVFHIYVDESSQTGHHYMVLGAVFCRKDAAAEMALWLSEAVATHKQRADKELHWTELKGHTLPLYLDAASYLIDCALKDHKMRYRALVVDTHLINNALSNSRDETLAKFIFTLVFKFVRDFGPNIQYHVWIDKRQDHFGDDHSDVVTLCSLNNKAKSAFGWAEGPFTSVKFIDSKRSRLVQATDVLTGAVAYETNGKHLLADASRHRIALLRHIVARTGLKTLAKPTRRWPFNFQIAHFDFEKSRALRRDVQ